MPVRRAASALEKLSQNRPGPIEISRVMLLAAGAAALSERDEMSVFIDFATRMELLQLEAKQPPASMVSALELAADLWLQVHRYEEAERAYEVAAREFGTTPRIRSGRAKLAAQTGRTMRACLEYRELMAWWGGRSPASVPTEIAEARAFLAQKTCASPAIAPVSK
jgi:hypothetical protein